MKFEIQIRSMFNAPPRRRRRRADSSAWQSPLQNIATMSLGLGAAVEGKVKGLNGQAAMD